MNAQFWRGRRVLVTGHTGFKGSWLCLWLASLGAEVHGYALSPPTDPALFDVAKVGDLLAASKIADVRDCEALSAAVGCARPEVVFHLAAQPLVRYSYRAPVETYAVNVMGTVHLLEAVRQNDCVRAVVSVTTDKCYENREWPWGYRENEPLGGHDPYSSSKACAELVSAAYRASFLAESGVALATARAGNVIGGGDWAADRLLPDFLRAIDAGETLTIRSPGAIRPWQHVLEPLSGYLALAEALVESRTQAAEAWNFGPVDDDARPVGWILDHLAARVPELRWQCDSAPQPHEANYLKLDSSKARSRLGWAPRWRLDKALDMTVTWHRAWRQGDDMRALSLAQIAEYVNYAGGVARPVA
jgi:CDP-glucose 4,6-dehydratase